MKNKRFLEFTRKYVKSKNKKKEKGKAVKKEVNGAADVSRKLRKAKAT